MKFELHFKFRLPMLNSQFFAQVDGILKRFFTPVMLSKQRDQMNVSLCYDVAHVQKWHKIIEVRIRYLCVMITSEPEVARVLLQHSRSKNKIKTEVSLIHCVISQRFIG